MITFPLVSLKRRYVQLSAVCSVLLAGTAHALEPQITSTGPTDASVGTQYTYQVVATDPEGGALSYALQNSPASMTLSATGEVNWTPVHVEAGLQFAQVRVTDEENLSVTESILMTVVDPNNQLPVIGQLPVTQMDYGQLYNYDLQATDGDGDLLTYQVFSWPGVQGLQISSEGLVSWTPIRDDVGQVWITVEVDDGHLGVVTYDYYLTIIDPNNNVPVSGQQPITQTNHGELYTYDPQITDGDGDSLTYEVFSWPSVQGLQISSTGVVTWTPIRDDVGQVWITVEADDDHLGVLSESYNLTVNDPANQAPGFTSIPLTQASVGSLYQYTAAAIDGDGDTVGYVLDYAPSGMTIDSATGLVQWIPTVEVPAPGEWVKIDANDNYGGTTRQEFFVVVAAGGGSNTAPTITSTALNSALEGTAYTYDVNATDAEADPLTYSLSVLPEGMSIDMQTGLISWIPTSEQGGSHAVTVNVSDGQLSTYHNFTITVAVINQLPQVLIQEPLEGATFTETDSIVFNATASDVEDGDLSSVIQWSSNVDGALDTGANIVTSLTVGTHTVTATVTDSQSETSSAAVFLTITAVVADPDLPPDPATVAPPLVTTQVTGMKAATDFLYTGANAIQTGVNPDDIEAERVAVLRGKVLNRDDSVLSGVTVTIKDHPEYGQTISREDGMFDMAVNGGGTLVVQYQKEGYLPVQRQISVPWRDFAHPDNVVMVPLDIQVTAIDLQSNEAMQVAQGSPQTDEDGTRQATVFFPQGTSATMTLPNGSTQSLNSLNVRATEYTVGGNGPEAMPGTLPATSGYTYAVELSVDEALAVNATRVDFDQPLPVYVDNFLDFPTGEVAPVGWYDPARKAWVPSASGRVIEIASINNGLAELVIDKSGEVAGIEELADLGITDAERAQLASLYTVGNTMWRTPITHFTPLYSLLDYVW